MPYVCTPLCSPPNYSASLSSSPSNLLHDLQSTSVVALWLCLFVPPGRIHTATSPVGWPGLLHPPFPHLASQRIEGFVHRSGRRFPQLPLSNSISNLYTRSLRIL